MQEISVFRKVGSEKVRKKITKLSKNTKKHVFLPDFGRFRAGNPPLLTLKVPKTALFRENGRKRPKSAEK
jgi:hypothetical protein